MTKEKIMFDVNTLDPKKVTSIPFTGPGVEYEDCLPVELKEVYVNPQKINHARFAGKNEYQVQRLVITLSNGIYYDRPPLIIRELPNPKVIDGVTYRYELLCGHHRFEALRRLGYTKWLFWLYKVGLNGYSYVDSVRTLQFLENDHDAALPSEAEDVSLGIAELIDANSRLVMKDEDSIREYVNAFCKNMHPNTRAKIVRQVMAKVGVTRRISTYTSNDAYDWIEKHTDYKKAGEYDMKRKKYGWSVLEGYEYEMIFNAIRKYAETGKESYFICRTKAPTKDNDLEAKRNNVLNTFGYLNDCLKEVFEFYQKNGEFPWEVEAFLPQDTENEELDKPIFIQ
jgi:hypothetical protein